jgi:peroxiredoxin
VLKSTKTLLGVYLGRLLALSLVLNVGFAVTLSTYRARISAERLASALKEGMSVQDLQGKDEQGNKVAKAFSEVSVPTVLYVVSPTCTWCARNAENVKFLAGHASDKFRFVGVSLSRGDLREYSSRAGYPFPLLNEIEPGVLKSYRPHGTPQTIVVAPDGKVLKSWEGAYAGSLQKEVEEWFHVSLPGLSEVTTMSGGSLSTPLDHGLE